MVHTRAFRALRPTAESAPEVLALPYDVMNVAEARELAKGRPNSFLHVSRAEIDLDEGVDPYSDAVYEQSARALEAMVYRQVLTLDTTPTLSVYRMRMGGLEQVGIVVAASVDDYVNGEIKKHELTRPDKENDRVRHIDAVGSHDEPVFLLSPPNSVISRVIADAVNAGVADYSATSEAGVSHEVWVVSDPAVISDVVAAYESMPALYVADGHHRSAAAHRVRDLRRERSAPGTDLGAAEYFLAVVVPSDAVTLMPYHRAVSDLGGLNIEQFLAAVARSFDVTSVEAAFQPTQLREFAMYLDSQWYRLTPLVDHAPDVLDVTVLQHDLFEPVLGISDPRLDQRLHFIGGIRGLPELERLVDEGLDAVSFALTPTSVQQLIDVADRNEIMPPKSTWFEPKLGSGLFIHPMS